MSKRHLSHGGERIARYWDNRADEHRIALHGGAANLAIYTPRRAWQRTLADDEKRWEITPGFAFRVFVIGMLLGAIFTLLGDTP